MKRYTELTQEELLELSDERTQYFIDLEIAHAGIIPVDAPVAPVLTEPNIVPNIEAFEIHGLIFLNQDDAIAVSRLPALAQDYDYHIGDKYRTLKPKSQAYGPEGVIARKFYDPSAVAIVRGQLIDIKKEKERYDREKTEWDKYQNKIRDIRDGVYCAISNARSEKASTDRAQEVYAKHLKLAENNEEIAKNFFREAYKNDPEMIEKILGEKPAETIIK
jgi:hypothetical protein